MTGQPPARVADEAKAVARALALFLFSFRCYNINININANANANANAYATTTMATPTTTRTSNAQHSQLPMQQEPFFPRASHKELYAEVRQSCNQSSASWMIEDE
jgi:hypothetical protein